jgi:hypothetical protein
MSWPITAPSSPPSARNLRARNIHRLDTIADDSKNDMARVASIKALEAITDQAEQRDGPVGSTQTPGVQIVIMVREPVAMVAGMPVISVEPTPAMMPAPAT